MLDRVAVHQTRLRTPGLGLDPKGVALGAKGLVLLPSIDRLVAFLALYTRGGSFEDILRSLGVEVVRSKLGAREVTLTFSAESSERMDRVAEVARLAGGFTFTGTTRHFVQYRDAGAPFGYDISEIMHATDGLSLYHNAFSQSYELERKVSLPSLLRRLEPHLDPSTRDEPGPRWLLCESGLGAALIQYFVRSNVDAEVGMAEWPPQSAFDESPLRRFLFRVSELPDRMVPLLTGTPGLMVFLPTGEGVAVEVGYRHPIHLQACPVFEAEGLVLFRGAGRSVLELQRVPAMGHVQAFSHVEIRSVDDRQTALSTAIRPDEVRLALRLLPTSDAWRSVTASRITAAELPILRRVAYALGGESLRRVTVAFTAEGAFLRHRSGIEAIPVGEFFREVCSGVYIPAGFDAVPAVSPDVLHRALGAPTDHIIFVQRDGAAVGIPEKSFVSLETALLEAHDWAPLSADEIESAMATELPEVVLSGVGFRPMRDVGEPNHDESLMLGPGPEDPELVE